MYPTVGLQTPGEVVDANFGQEPFEYDIEDMMRELRLRTRLAIYDFPVPESQREEEILAKYVFFFILHYLHSTHCFFFFSNIGSYQHI